MDYFPQIQPDLAPVNLPQFEYPRTEYHHPLTQRVHGLYGVDGVSAFVQQAHLSDGLFATTQNQAPHQFSWSIGFPHNAQYDAELVGTGPSGPGFAVPDAPDAPAVPSVSAGAASPMGPPAQPRKRKAPTLRTNDWEPYKQRILDLHTTQKLPLPRVKQMIEEEYGFKAEYAAPVRAR